MQKQYKLFATDMDGTLLSDRKEISGENLKAMRQLHRQGIEVAICTGRHFYSVKDYLKTLDFPCWLISNNGAVIRNTKGGICSVTNINKNSLIEVIDVLEEEGLYYHISDSMYNYIRSPLERMRKIREYMIRTNRPKFDTLWYPIYAVLFSGHYKKVNHSAFVRNGGKAASIFVLSDDYEKLDAVRKKLMNISDIDVSSSGRNNLEILSKEATKGHSLGKLASKLNISTEEVVAVGDNYNDLTMIQYAGLGVAMENGEETIKKCANWITKSNEENGIAHLIYEKVI